MKTLTEMAREAGIRDCTCNGALGCLERFASLVRADERARMAEQPAQQEPVAYLVDGDLYYPEEIDWETLQEQGHTVAALYTSPPAQRTWVGLTNDEKAELDAEYGDDTLAHLDAIEAKLKEKNT